MVSIIIIDDSDAVRMVLKDIIMIGKHVLAGELNSGEKSLEEYTKLKPDIVLLDMAMPKKDGITVLKEIIGFDQNAKIIMISASDNHETIKECMRLGAKEYILKPFDFQKVLDKITQVSNS